MNVLKLKPRSIPLRKSLEAVQQKLEVGILGKPRVKMYTAYPKERS
ncbi:MAG: hypothetical protein QXL96_12290 [Ignisphaera sp.]